MEVVVQKKQNFKYYLAGFVAAVTFAVYLVSLQNHFIVEWDDGEYVVNNPHIRSINLAFLRWAFFDFHASNWHPLTWISHAIDYTVWGANPLGHHLTSVILHAVNAFMVVLLIMRLQEVATGPTPSGQETSVLDEHGMLITAGVTGLLFGLHPVHVESVAWIAERKDLLCALFFLLSIIGYVKYVKVTGNDLIDRGVRICYVKKEYLLSLVFFILALMSKPMAVSLPVVLMILDWYPFRRLRSVKTAWILLVEKLPFITFSLISSVLTVLAQRAGGAIIEIQALPLSSRLLVAAQSLIMYLWKIIVPWDLIPYYPYPKNISFASLEFLSAIALVVGITIFCIIIAKRLRLGLAAWGYYVVTLLPVIGIVQVGSQMMADRYTYLPSLAPFLIIAAGTSWGYNKGMRLNLSRSMRRILFFSTGIFIFAGLSFLSIRQIPVWESGLSLWSYVIEKEPEVSIAYTNLGSVYQKMGQYDMAMEKYDKAITLDPNDYLAYTNRGVIFDRLGQFDKALESYKKAMISNPGDYKAYFNRGLTYDKMGRVADAIEDFQIATKLNMPDPMVVAWAYNNLGILYTKADMYERSIAAFNISIAVEPNNPYTFYNRGFTYAYSGQYDRAIEDFDRAILLDKNYGNAYFHRGDAYLRTGNRERAISDFKQGCDLGDMEACDALQASRLMMAPEKKN
jgi:tetratricopeptide (TPR) repeat protein